MRRKRVAAAIVLVACGLLAVAVLSARNPAPASAAASAPAVTSGSASNLGQSSATLSGTVNPNGQSTTYYFQYGTSTTYGTQTSPADAGSGSTPVGVHQAIFGLTPNTTYHYRLVATSSAGTTNGTDQTFTTPTTTPSQTVVLGHEGFVSPGWIVGAEVGCFHGTTTCSGHLTMSHAGVTIAQRDYSIP
ncbi:MAG: fibronectin type III domain-containing protein, partial [Solirubrobacteraceae bacterium]